MPELRFYGLTHFMLSSIQQGLQAAHCIADMFVRYQHTKSDTIRNMLDQWAKYDKTIILLNGGNCADLYSKYLAIRRICETLQYPYEMFSEDQQSLNNAITCVGLIVPETIYKMETDLITSEYPTDETDLALLLQSMSLAK